MVDKEIIKEIRSAIKANDLNNVKKLLEENPSLIKAQTPFGSFLHEATMQGKYNIAEYLIRKGINVNNKNGLGNTSALREAAYSGNINILKLLYDNGANIDITSSEENPLFAAIPNNHIEIVKYLVDQGIDITAKYDIGEIKNCDAMEYARQYSCTEIYNYLKEKLEQFM